MCWYLRPHRLSSPRCINGCWKHIAPVGLGGGRRGNNVPSCLMLQKLGWLPPAVLATDIHVWSWSVTLHFYHLHVLDELPKHLHVICSFYFLLSLSLLFLYYYYYLNQLLVCFLTYRYRKNIKALFVVHPSSTIKLIWATLAKMLRYIFRPA